MLPRNKRTNAELQPIETIEITPEMSALAENAAQRATDAATEAYKREAMGKVCVLFLVASSLRAEPYVMYLGSSSPPRNANCS